MNNIIIKGRLTATPELRTTDSGVSVCSFSVAVNRRFDRETADFFNCVAWRQAAETICKYFTKGREILIQGEMQGEKWVDKDGNNKVSWKIQVEQFEFCGSKSNNTDQKATPSYSTADEGDFKAIPEDDLPF